MKKKYLFYSFIAIVAVCFSCTSTNLDDITPPPTGGGNCDSTYIFNGKIADIIIQNCSGIQHSSGCHGSGVGQGDFTNYAGIKAKIDAGAFVPRVLQNKDMPPGYSPGPQSLSPCDLKILENWINEGAPQ